MAKTTMRDERDETMRLNELRRLEDALSEAGYSAIAGVDEAGRGPLAGPVVAAAAILPINLQIPGINDSKQVSVALREKIFARLIEEKVPYAVGIGTVEEIDEHNILGATRIAMGRAVMGLPTTPDYLLIDAVKLPAIDLPQQGIIHGDALSVSIAAASIVAKVTRDRMMEEYDRMYPGYGFARHKGYPTRDHYAALAELGPSPIHRQSFRLIRDEQISLTFGDGGTG